MPNVQGLHFVARPAIEANNFEIKLSLISMIQQNQFGDPPLEDPHLHLPIFLESCDTLKINGVSNDTLKMRHFPFSLEDKARSCIYTLPK